MDLPPVLLSPQSQTCSHLAETCMEGERSPPTVELGRDSSFSSGQLPSSSLTDSDWFWNEHIQAKRARVETIVRGMCLSPSPLVSGSVRAREHPCYPEKVRERKRKQSLPMHQGSLKSGPVWDRASKKGGTRVKEQLHLLKQQLRHLQEHVLQGAEPRAPAQGSGGTEQRSPTRAKPRNSSLSSPRTMENKPQQSSNKDICGVVKPHVVEVQQQAEEAMLSPSRPRALVETLRKELSRAMSLAVDSVLQQVLLDPPGHLTQQEPSCLGTASESRSQPSPPGRNAYQPPLVIATLPRRVQPQAGVPLGNSLATLLDPPMCSSSPRAVPKPYQSPLSNCPLAAVPSHIWENQILSQLLGRGPDSHWSGNAPQNSSAQSRPSLESAQQPWGLSQQQLPMSFTPVHLESRPLPPSVKMEPGGLQGLADRIPFSSIHIQEGLSPGHLKKAKLMFFFTRYPSSSLLKAYFPDVQFNRCITSQMIKWFSNFREFYYIQMEKYARQAISDGVTNPKMLAVLRDSEIFRVLNTHYNKGNDFEVPDCFLEIATLTLQEFFKAVSTGRDSDPSWKKPIYKIISKLDSDIPEILKSSNYAQELFRS